MRKWIKKLLSIVKNYDRDNQWFIGRIVAAESLIKDRTDINADVRFHGPDRNQIIVTGRYRNADYVQVFTLPDRELRGLIEQLREMERFGVVDKVDAVRDIKAVITRELEF